MGESRHKVADEVTVIAEGDDDVTPIVCSIIIRMYVQSTESTAHIN